MKNLPQLLLEAERAFDEKFRYDTNLYYSDEDGDADVIANADVKSFFRETVLSILSEAEKATEVEKTKGGNGYYKGGFGAALSQVKSLWREWRGNLI